MDDYTDYECFLDPDEEIDEETKNKLKSIVSAEPEVMVDQKTCPHSETIIEEGEEYCNLCLMHLTEKDVNYIRDNKYLGFNEVGFSKDYQRCSKRRMEERNIFKDVENLGFPDSIIRSANKKYQQIIKDDIYRSSNRKAIISACIYHAYAEEGEHRTSEEISALFGIKRKTMKEGFTKYYETFREASTQYITPKQLVKRIMIKTHMDFPHLKKINILCDYLNERSVVLNRSTPQSVAAAIVYLYLCLNPEYKEKLKLNKLKFSNIVGLSDITITKLGKEAQKIIKNDTIKI
jgi:transcription initiation factor TFIIIB Brf1 subunit/transcription initiation factor TFIIB